MGSRADARRSLAFDAPPGFIRQKPSIIQVYTKYLWRLVLMTKRSSISQVADFNMHLYHLYD